MSKKILAFASLSGAISVGLGAFGAHALKESLQLSGRTGTYETAVDYQFYHTLALFVIALLMIKDQQITLKYAAYCMITGIIIFSGSLYFLCFTNVTILGAVTPIGGISLIAGWVLTFIYSIKKAG